MKKHLEHIVSLIFVIIACTLASCQEYDPFGEDVVRAARYERQFSDAIGTPAPRHAWGFDIASFFMSQNQTQTRTIYKQDENICTTDENGNTVNLTVAEFYGKPADITQREHDEVYNWFTNHRVNWQNDYANCGDGNYFTGSTKQFDGKAYTRSGEEGYKMLDMGSLVTNSPNKIGTCSVDSTLFFNGWIQYVNSDYTYDEIALNGSKYNCSSMNNLKVVDLKGSYQVHLNEFNGSGGYGWGKQSGMNAILATDSNFNEIEYHSSIDGLYHDKYIIVHLVGSDYSGWYLGMDLEGGGQNGNQRVKADGVCNDWIIKICDAGQSMFNPARILCEDLGSNDFDFNDVVIDIAAEVGANCALATVTVKAVGGTIPVCITYGHPDDIEANAFNKDGKFELHELFGAAVGQPINVHAPGGMETTREISWKVGFGREYDEADYNYPDEQLNIHKFNVLVQHSSRAEWLTIRNYDEDNAVCAPQMICVPTTVDWPSENQPIVEKYPKFKEWVANPTKFFWTNTVSTPQAPSENTQTPSENTQQGNESQNSGNENQNQNGKLSISVEASDAACTVEGGGEYDRWSYITIKAEAGVGYQFVKWTKDGQDINQPASYSFNVGDDTAGSYVAVFEKLPTYAEMFGTQVASVNLENSAGIYNSYYAINTSSLPKEGTIILTFVQTGNDIYNNMNQVIYGANFDTSNEYNKSWVVVDLGGKHSKNSMANPLYETLAITIDASTYNKYEKLMLLDSNMKKIEGAYYTLVQ